MSKVQFPTKGESPEVLLQQLKDLKKNDLPWQSGKVFAYIYGAKPETMQMAADAYQMYLTENGLDPSSFPSLLHLEREVITMLCGLLHGGDEAVGNCTSGGTESVILAVKTARDYARATRPEITAPEIIICETAHPCFHKAGHYLGVKVVMIEADPNTYCADVKKMEAAINDQTILMVGSAPSYTHGVIDPIEELAAIAYARNILFHVDACVGGMYLPFAAMLGYDIPPFDFAVKGVTSISCDLHKYGYVPKGCSSILYRNKELRQYQLFSCSVWPGYTIVNPTVLSSKTGGPLAAAWSMFHHWGIEGYKKAVKECQEATQQFIEGLKTIPELQLIGDPAIALFTMVSKHEKLDIFQLADAMQKRGWYLQAQLASRLSPQGIHISISQHNVPHIDAVIEDLKICIAQLIASQSAQPSSADMMAGMDSNMIQLLLADFNPDMLDMLEAVLGTNESGLPDNMVMINNILNTLSTEQRDMLLTAFVNRMYSSR